MPCDQIVTSQVTFLPATTDLAILTDGLTEAGYRVVAYEASEGHRLQISKNNQAATYYAKTGRLEAPRSWDTSEITRAYSAGVVNSQARKFGWKVSWKTNAAGNREAEVLKR